MTLVRTAAALMAATFALGALAAGNTTNEDFRDSKKMLERKVYFDHRVTLYCGYAFDKQKNVSLPAGFVAPQHKERAGRVEWEHVVPAENFGRAFKEWREGDGRCTNEKGHFYKGRRCAEKMSAEYRLMQADMYNLFPAVGAVNAIRSNYNYEFLPGVPNTFGTCEMKIDGRRAEPPERSRGEIARAMLYDTRMLILDEATSSIDTNTEILVQEGIEQLLKGRTSFVIAHRLSTIQKADRIFVIDDGRIIEEGNAAQLLAQKGFYYDLYMSQFKNVM